MWEELFQRERERIVRLVVQRVDYDGRQEALGVVLRDAGIRQVTYEMPNASGNATP